MEQLAEFWGRVTSIQIIDIIIAIGIIVFFRILSGTFSYMIIRIFKIKSKTAKEIKESAFFKPLKAFFIILGIYLAIFVCNEYSSGYIKNIATLSNGRLAVIISKIVVAAVIDLIIILLCYGIGFILGNLLIDGFVIESIGVILKSSAVMFVMSLALFSLVIAITTVFRYRVAGIILVLLISSGMLQPFFTSLFDLVNLSFLSEYTLSSLFLNSALVKENEFVKVILTSFLYIVIYNGISIGITQKRDI